ncbi:DNA helicase MCM8 [Condylostylus longicornis]|uniref:DNA helicase MCM8 n=1 Tax=Condylostylus longicornis TaxID=2530218 RepID=UPI00244E47A0|nr:DNA helicase MCM8 [Condylostylus longicornis]
MANSSQINLNTSRQPTGAKPKNNFYRNFNPYWMKKRQNLPQIKPTIILLPVSGSESSSNLNNSALTGRNSNVSASNTSRNTSNNSVPSITLPLGQYHSFLLDKISPNEAYGSWKLYFSNEKYSADSPIIKKIKSFETHFKDNPEQYNLVKIYSSHTFKLDLVFIKNDSKFKSSWNNFHQDLIESPEITLSAAGLAMHTLCLKCSEIQNELNSTTTFIRKRTSFKIFRAYLENFSPIEDLASIRSKKYESLLSIRGTVVQTGESALISSWNTYECLICHSQMIVKQENGIVIEPNSCKKSGCNNKSKFKILLNSPYNRLEKYQTIRVQQLVTRGKQGDETKQIKQIEIELLNELVDKVAPGEDVILTGILKVRSQQENHFRQEDGLKLYLHGISIFKEKSYQNISAFTEKDLQAVSMIKEEPSPFRLLVQSLCPSIFGHEMVKAGLVLALLGGCGNEHGLRSEIHVLMVGDPGVGKSEMLKSCSQISSKEIFVSGCGSSVAGLTVTVTNRRNGGELEGGALVLADGAHCCIDEFDKTRANQQAVLEVMEQQTVGVAKAGVYCSIPARTSVLAAANPECGHYNRSKTVMENLKMSIPLLSRFDLIFIMVDKPNQNFDSMLTEHIQSYLSGNRKEPTENSFGNNSSRNQTLRDSFMANEEEDLEDRLRLRPGEDMDLLPRPLMQRYIAYAKKNCFPKLRDEAGEALQQFYIELRQISICSNLIPITARQFEGLIRLTQARARADLSQEATLNHAMDVISIFRFSMMNVFTTDTTVPDLDTTIGSGTGSGKSRASQIKIFLTLLQQASRAQDKQIFDIRELKEIASLKGLDDNIIDLVESLNSQGYLLKKSPNVYRLIL